jgi:hypothetical protein
VQYAILCYDREEIIEAWTKAEEDRVIGQHRAYASKLAQKGKLGPVLRLLPTSAAMTVRSGDQPLVVDGPFAETKEQLLGLWIVDTETPEEALEIAMVFSGHKGHGSLEVRPLREMVSLAAVA